ncbi:Myeloid-associated differentiation marker-like protein 2 [Triplophysa tibetana]|uniref:Myeloid-associated differentiation marker-like protein 2 n=1 Tax=Triplophysa tibetana TaxID=1572043 RepID=A0A5A9N9T5_9TELE|nr:Myeloid-associated differentiation marker-like protein 2 [Triplophysa tibetana]
MGFCGLSLSQTFRILEFVFCILALLIPTFRGSTSSPYGIWCEFVWAFGAIVALVIFVMEKCLLAKVLEDCVLKHSWDDLSCGLTLLSSLMLLSASVIFCVLFVCSTCFADMCCAIASIVAFGVYVADAVKLKLKCLGGYLSNGRGILRFSQAFVACLMFAAVYNYFKGVENRYRPAGLMWCILVYVVCFLPSVVVILKNLQKWVNLPCCCDLMKMELVVDGVSVALYISAAILWPAFGYKNYQQGISDDHEMYNYRFHDMNVITVLTYVNLGLYTADLIWCLIILCKRR